MSGMICTKHCSLNSLMAKLLALNNEPLVTDIYTADPSAHVFNHTLYVYPSHDRVTEVPNDDLGSQYDMVDYHVLSLEYPDQRPATEFGVALSKDNVPWASKEMWAPDAAFKNGKYYLYFPAHDYDDIFRIGVATSDCPEGPFEAEPEPIPGSYSIDPASFVDEDGQGYLYFGGIGGGQLQCWQTEGFFNSSWIHSTVTGANVTALLPRVAKLSDDMLSFDGDVRGVEILDENGELLLADDQTRRFFEASWVHKRNGTYYFTYSTGNSHYLVYATGTSPLGPFTYRGRILEPVLGWTTHGSIVEWKGKWWLFYHDATLSGGISNLRNVKMREILYDDEGSISLAEPQ
ncbi:putative xylosidase [Flagelloscypha sp. PMI_526]|nr:putative xylosidase [Flagelloscypha sp. PMI_526]